MDGDGYIFFSRTRWTRALCQHSFSIINAIEHILSTQHPGQGFRQPQEQERAPRPLGNTSEEFPPTRRAGNRDAAAKPSQRCQRSKRLVIAALLAASTSSISL